MTVRENVIVGLSNQRSMTSHTDNLSTHRTIGGTDSGLSSNVDSDLLSIAASCATLSGLSRNQTNWDLNTRLGRYCWWLNDQNFDWLGVVFLTSIRMLRTPRAG